jgi:hypothetical protein
MKTIQHIILLSTIFTTLSLSDIINVPADIDSIQGGIDLANDGDTVLVDVGIYYEKISFNGKKITVASLYLTTNDKSYISETVLDGSQEHFVVMIDGGVDSTAVLCGFTITNGRGWGGNGVGGPCGPCPRPFGGGITCRESNPTLTNLRIIGNWREGIFLANSSPILKSLIITENYGVGIYIGGVSNPKFDSVHRCNIYLNYGDKGRDIEQDMGTLAKIVNVVVDTFTVMSPTDFHAYPRNYFTFDILNSKIVQANSDLYVSPLGNDSNSGLSSEEPLKTMSFAMMKIFADSLNPHTIYLANGEYVDQYNFFTIDYLSIVGESRSGVIFRNDSSSMSVLSVFEFRNVKGVSLENITILGNGETLGIYCPLSSPVIRNVTLNGAGMTLSGGNPYIEDVKICGNISWSCIFIVESIPTLMNVEITNNSGKDVIFCRSNSHLNMINCTISGNKSLNEESVGIRIWDGSSLSIVNSIIWDNPPFEIGVINSRSIMIMNSLLKGSRSGIHVFSGEINLDWREGNIDTVPMFVDKTNGDYRLNEGSPCIDAGIQDTFLVYNNGQDTIYIPPLDYIGSAPDIGAYEYGNPLTIEEETIKFPITYTLCQNYPNPFNSSTTIEFDLPKASEVILKVFNILGEEVTILVSKKLNSGNHTFQFDGKNLASGIYYYQLVTGDYRKVKKMILLK